jgi:hypothetical protein
VVVSFPEAPGSPAGWTAQLMTADMQAVTIPVAMNDLGMHQQYSAVLDRSNFGD